MLDGSNSGCFLQRAIPTLSASCYFRSLLAMFLCLLITRNVWKNCNLLKRNLGIKKKAGHLPGGTTERTNGLCYPFSPVRTAFSRLMGSSSSHDVTQLLRAWSAGEQDALDKLTPLVYRELHLAAKRHMRRQQPDHTLQTTALVNEVYLKLVAFKEVSWQDRAHFFAV